MSTRRKRTSQSPRSWWSQTVREGRLVYVWRDVNMGRDGGDGFMWEVGIHVRGAVLYREVE